MAVIFNGAAMINEKSPGAELTFDDYATEVKKKNTENLSLVAAQKTPKNWFSRPISINADRKYCIILQYFRPSLSYHLSLRPLFCLFLSGLLRQILLYLHFSLIRDFTTEPTKILI